jgi:hypothetical protein
MRKYLNFAWRLVSLWVFVSLLIPGLAPVRGAIAQTAKTTPQSTDGISASRFEIGARTVVIPAPEGYVDALPSLPELKPTLGGIDNEIEFLAIHIPKDEMKGLEQHLLSVTRLTGAGFLKETKDKDLEESDFPDLVAAFKQRQNNSTLFNIDDPRVKAALEQSAQRIAAATSAKVKLEWQQPVNLGIVEETGDRLIFMMLLTLNLQLKSERIEAPFVGGVAFIRVNRRLLFAYTFREYQTTSDVLALKDFTQRWVGQIIAANQK